MHYVPNRELAFNSIEQIMRDVKSGYMMRYLHANGASMFFLIVYLHICRSLYYGSYMKPRQWAWVSGVVILVIMILTAFMGYVLPWGQMSFWAATVITNLASAIPFIGPSIVEWLWGGFSVDNATLNRFFSFHYLFPFLLTAGVGAHLALVHQYGSNNPIGVDVPLMKIAFYPYFYVKDILGLDWLLILFGFFVFFEPNVLGHPDNYIPANPLSTPAHIVPEWYFLPFYAILRTIPDKLGGVICMGASLVFLGLLPFFSANVNIRTSIFRPHYKTLISLFVVDCVILGWAGQKVVESPFLEIGIVGTCYYFFFFFATAGLAQIEKEVYKNA
jgi:ubiquinol-cytochrome c reductase cytochrome b subunit